MRVYCHVHQRSFSTENHTPVICEQGGHALGSAPNDPNGNDLWEYCCDCQNFWLVSPDGPGASECPVCDHLPRGRYLCDQCHTVTLEASGDSSRDFFLSLQGAARPFCPGCSRSENGPLLKHECKAYAARLTTPRPTCPFCLEGLRQLPTFPVSVADYLSRFAGDQLEVVVDGESRHLVTTTSGSFLLLNGKNGFQGSYLLLPRLARFESERDFRELYQDYYLCDEPAAGDVIIIYPASVERIGEHWTLKNVGRLRVDPSEKARDNEQAEQPSQPQVPPLPPDAQQQINRPFIPEVSSESAGTPVVTVPVPDQSAVLPSASGPSPLRLVLVFMVAMTGVMLVIGFLAGLITIIAALREPAHTTVDPEPPQATPTKKTLEPSAPAGMVYVSGGKFTMGNNEGDEYERPAHLVTLKPFFIDSLEVTCAEYTKFVSATGHKTPVQLIESCPARHPITGIDWEDANAYAAWAGKRLPTEEEWEFAARGFDERRYPWGNNWRAKLANAGAFSAGELVDVGSYPEGKSPFGPLDMVGNAWEWTASDLKAYANSNLSEQRAHRKVIRGGSWARDNPPDWTTTFRGFAAPTGGKDYSKVGFRCAKDG
jgi:formylglycine-generating enzyme required for sulfatase activity